MKPKSVWSLCDRDRTANLNASASAERLWDMEGQTLDLNHCLCEVRVAISELKPDQAQVLVQEVRDRIRQLLSDCDDLESLVKVDQLLSKCPD